MLSLHDISAWVEVDGEVLEEYGVEVDHVQSQVTCWIAAQIGKNFSVVFKDNAERDYSLCSRLRLDGSPVGGKVVYPRISDRKVVQSDQLISANSGRPFIFSKLELTDDDNFLNRASSHLGEINLRIRRVQALNEVPFEPGPIISGHGKIHERSKKAVSHCVSYGKEVKMAPHMMCRIKYLDGDVPLVTFIFKYRDSSLLQANGIMRKPHPAESKAVIANEVLDLTTDDDVEPGPFGDDIEIVDGGSEDRVTGSSKRRTALENVARPKKKIKRERHAAPYGDIIDLT